MQMQLGRLAVPVSAADHVTGNTSAPVTLVEYGDYECPYCGRAFWVLQQLKELVGDQILFAYRHFPLTQVHPHADQAAEAAEAAGAQGKFWEMHDMLFRNQQALDPMSLRRYAAAIGLELARFDADMASGAHRPKVRQDFLSGARSGVNGTPTFFINGVRHDGGWDLQGLLSGIRRAAGKPAAV
jgi:protein-disulfide isomerase